MTSASHIEDSAATDHRAKLAEAEQILALYGQWRQEMDEYTARCCQMAEEWTERHWQPFRLWHTAIGYMPTNNPAQAMPHEIVVVDHPATLVEFPTAVTEVGRDGSCRETWISMMVYARPVDIVAPSIDFRWDYCQHRLLGSYHLNCAPYAVVDDWPQLDSPGVWRQYVLDRIPNRTLRLPEWSGDYPDGATDLSMVQTDEYVAYYS